MKISQLINQFGAFGFDTSNLGAVIDDHIRSRSSELISIYHDKERGGKVIFTLRAGTKEEGEKPKCVITRLGSLSMEVLSEEDITELFLPGAAKMIATAMEKTGLSGGDTMTDKLNMALQEMLHAAATEDKLAILQTINTKEGPKSMILFQYLPKGGDIRTSKTVSSIVVADMANNLIKVALENEVEIEGVKKLE